MIVEKLTQKEALRMMREPVLYEFIGDEKEFEAHIVDHIDMINEALSLPDIESVYQQRQFRAETFQCKFDIVIRHKDGTATIFEVKKANRKHPATGPYLQMQAIGQLLLYQNVFEQRTGGKPRLVLIDNKIYERTVSAFAGNSLPITLVEFQCDRIFVPYRGW